MPRSSRHKSRKHSFRDSRDYSDPEKESYLRERKRKDESVATVSKESGSGDKRKLDTKEHYDSKRHKENDERGETSKKSKKRSRKRRDSSRRERKEFDKGRDSKYKEGKREKLFDGEDHQIVPGKAGKKQSRGKKENQGIGHKHQGDIGDLSDRAFTSGDDCLEHGIQTEEKCRDKKRVDTEEANNQCERDRYHERDWDRGQSRNRDWDHDSARTRDREKDHSRDYCHNRKRCKIDHELERESDFDVSYLDQTGQYKDCKERRRSPDDQDDVNDNKSRITAAHTDMDTRGSRGQRDGDNTRSQRQPSSLVAQEECGYVDQKAKGLSSKQAADLSGVSEGCSNNNRVSENTAKMEDGSVGEFQVERSSDTKASPRPLERRYINSTGASQSVEVEVTGQRNISRDFLASEADRFPVDETLQAELSLNKKANQNNSSFPPPGGISSPKVGPLEGDNFPGRYRRRGDANMRREQQGNVWRASRNRPSPLIPNRFIPFQHGPLHGGFQYMMPLFPSPSLFGVRPSMEMSHSGIPYHMTNAERFSAHLRPLGWENMMDVSGPHKHGFFKDMSNGNIRDESGMYGGAEWDHNRRMQGQGWDPAPDAWKTQNGHVSMDFSSMSVKEDKSAQVFEGDTLAVQTSHSEIKRAKSVKAGSYLKAPAKELAVSSLKVLFQEAYEDTVAETMDTVERYCRRHYLSKLDISVKLTDAELHTQCMWLLKSDECRPTSDDGIAVFVNLKDGGKPVPKTHCSSLTSVIPTKNNAVFQIAMELYKEQRYQMKGVSSVKHERPQVSPPHLENDTKIDMEADDTLMEIGDASELDTSQKMEQEAALPELEERGSPANPGNSTEVREDAAMSEDEDKKDVVIIVEDDLFSNCESD
ncbi:hypothetical protein EUTSA_v10026934mg, partial [Eutrema salsugineum]